jgi:hypothetical protein
LGFSNWPVIYYKFPRQLGRRSFLSPLPCIKEEAFTPSSPRHQGSMLPLAKQSSDEAPYKLSGAVAKLVGITFSRLAFSYWIDNLGFITEGKLASIFIKPSLGVSNWLVIYYTFPRQYVTRITMRFTLGITTKYIDRHPTASMTNSPLTGISSEHPMSIKL